MKAMILAAGKGERLRPLTNTIPKPLVKAGGHALIEYHLMQLKKTGVTEIVLNVSYMAENIMQYLGSGERYGVKLFYSCEPMSLGTGGGIKRALYLLGEKPFLLVSADIWSEYTFPKTFLEAQGDVHLLLVDNPAFHQAGDYGLSENSFLTKSGPKYTYAGIAKINPKIFTKIDKEHFSFSPLIDHAIDEHHATGELYHGAWFNVGTKKQLDALHQYLGDKT